VRWREKCCVSVFLETGELGDCIGTKLLTAEFAEEVAEDAEKGKEYPGIGNIFFATFGEFYSATSAVKSFCSPHQ
jgi:hypothetical protein